MSRKIILRLLVCIFIFSLVTLFGCVSTNKSLIKELWITKDVIKGRVTVGAISTAHPKLTTIDLDKPENKQLYIAYSTDPNFPGSYLLKFSLLKPNGELWLNLYRKILNKMSSAIDPVARWRRYLKLSTTGMENYPGQWTLNAYVNEELSESMKFTVQSSKLRK